MIRIRRSALVGHSAAEMFDLVNEVEAYPRRFRWCSGASVLERDGDGLTARLDLRLAGMTHTFTTRNTWNRPERLEVRLVDGPLRSLDGVWTFAALGPAETDAGAGPASTGCKVVLELDFDFSGRLAGKALQLGFQGLANRLVDEFCRAADDPRRG